MTSVHVHKHPLKTLAFFLGAGSAIFVLGLFLVLYILSFTPTKFDSSVVYLYPWMAGLGTLFGFERWWSYEYGESNPFHDR